MPEATIIRTQIIVVDKVSKNTYGGLTFTDKENKEYKISANRIGWFEKIIIPDMAVQLSYAMSTFGKEYIYSAIQVKDKLLPPVTQQKPIPIPFKPLKPSEIKAVVTSQKDMSKEDWAEKDRITRKSIERQVSLTAAIELAKIKGTDDTEKILATAGAFEAYLETGIGIQKEVLPSKSRLVEEARKLGATENK